MTKRVAKKPAGEFWQLVAVTDRGGVATDDCPPAGDLSGHTAARCSTCETRVVVRHPKGMVAERVRCTTCVRVEKASVAT